MKASLVFLIITYWFCPKDSLAQQQDFKGYFFVKSYVNQKGVEVPEIQDLFFKTPKGTYFVKDCAGITQNKEKLHLKKAIIRGSLMTGLLDDCTTSELNQSRVGQHLVIIDYVVESTFYFSLSDGSGNTLTLKEDKLSYFPVTREMSSSGVYDGGIQKEMTLSSNDRILIMRNFRKTMHATKPILCQGLREKGKVIVSYAQLGEDQDFCCPENKKWQKFIRKTKKQLGQ